MSILSFSTNVLSISANVLSIGAKVLSISANVLSMSAKRINMVHVQMTPIRNSETPCNSPRKQTPIRATQENYRNLVVNGDSGRPTTPETVINPERVGRG